MVANSQPKTAQELVLAETYHIEITIIYVFLGFYVIDRFLAIDQ